jgi:hypothetical protein
MQAAIQQAIDSSLDTIDDLNLMVYPSQDPKAHIAFVNELNRSSNSFPISTAIDPEYCTLNPQNFFWAGVRTESGRPIASVATRLIDEDLIRLIQTGRLWANRRPVAIPFKEFIYPDDAPRLEGKSVFGSGLYVHPEFRHMNIAGSLARLTMLMSERMFRPDWHACLRLKKPGMHTLRELGYSESYKVFRDGNRRGLNFRDVWLCFRPVDQTV